MPRVNRKYDSRGRRQQAEESRQRVLQVARRRFFDDGYAATTVGQIAGEAGVSVETIYKAFGGKPGLVRALVSEGLAGRGPVHAEDRSDAVSASAKDAPAIFRQWGALFAEVSPRVAPLLCLVRAAAASDPALRPVLDGIDRQRLDRMQKNARVLSRRGLLRRGTRVNRAGDLLWALTAPELYDLLVVRRGWTAEELGEWIATVLEAALSG